MRRVHSLAPFDLVDFLFDFETLEIVEFRFMRLKLCVEFIFAAFFLNDERWEHRESP